MKASDNGHEHLMEIIDSNEFGYALVFPTDDGDESVRAYKSRLGAFHDALYTAKSGRYVYVYELSDRRCIAYLTAWCCCA